MYQRIFTVYIALVLLLLTFGLMPVHGETQIYQTALRLHVIAASDSEEDQALKLSVRDAVLKITDPLLSDCNGIEDAVATLESYLPQIEAAAERVLRDAGREETVSALLGREEYPRKSYDRFCFPAGEYLSLRVVIGEGEGENWWCCLFPPMCLGAATVPTHVAEDACISVGLTPTQYRIITKSEEPVYRVRFKLLELFSSTRS